MLDIEPLLIAVTTVIFFVLLYQLNIKLYRPLLRFMDNRDMSIAKDLKNANSVSGNTDELLQKAQSNIDQAKAEANKLRQDAINQAKIDANIAMEAKQDELENIGKDFKIKLEEEKISLQNSLQSQIPLIKESLKAKFSQL